MALYKPPSWILKHADPWRPGDWGKGFLTPDQLITWSVGQAHDGWPFHSVMQGELGDMTNQVIGRRMAEDKNFYGVPTVDFWIDPHGRVAYWNRPGMSAYAPGKHDPAEMLSTIGKQINAYDPRLQSTDDWIDNQFYGGNSQLGIDWPCPRCQHPHTNADSSCPNCNYRPEEGSYFLRGKADDPTSQPQTRAPAPRSYGFGDHDSIIQHHLKKLDELNNGGHNYGYGFCPFCGWGLTANEYINKCPNCGSTIEDRNRANVVPGLSQHCPECGDPLNASGDCLNCLANYGAGTSDDLNNQDWRELSREDVGKLFEQHQLGMGNGRECADCGEPLNDHGDCENPLCYMSPDFYGAKESSTLPTLVEAQSLPLTVANDPHHRADRRPVVYLPHRNAIYVGQPATHHVQLKNEFEIPRHSGMYGYIRPNGIDWLNGVGMPEDVEDMLRNRYLSDADTLAPSWDVNEWSL
jgi:rubrerythrin